MLKPLLRHAEFTMEDPAKRRRIAERGLLGFGKFERNTRSGDFKNFLHFGGA